MLAYSLASKQIGVKSQINATPEPEALALVGSSSAGRRPEHNHARIIELAIDYEGGVLARCNKSIDVRQFGQHSESQERQIQE